MTDGENISYLIEHGMSLEDIRLLMERRGVSLEEMRTAVESRLARGLPVVEPPERRTGVPVQEPNTDAPKPRLVRACDIPYEPPRWTIAPYFQRGKGTLIQGDNGTGKTAFMCAIAAHVTTGNPLRDMSAVIAQEPDDAFPMLLCRLHEILRGLFLHELCHILFHEIFHPRMPERDPRFL